MSLFVALVPPKRLPIENTVAYTGRMVSLSCPVASYPPAKVKWMRPSHVLLNNNGYAVNNTLTIMSVKPNHGGVYLCEAKNKFGSTFTAVGLEVRDPGKVFFVYYSRDRSKYLNEIVNPGLKTSTVTTATATTTTTEYIISYYIQLRNLPSF